MSLWPPTISALHKLKDVLSYQLYITSSSTNNDFSHGHITNGRCSGLLLAQILIKLEIVLFKLRHQLSLTFLKLFLVLHVIRVRVGIPFRCASGVVTNGQLTLNIGSPNNKLH